MALTAEAMALGRIEAIGAGLVLGPLFPLLDRLGLAGAVTAEAGKARSAAAWLRSTAPRPRTRR